MVSNTCIRHPGIQAVRQFCGCFFSSDYREEISRMPRTEADFKATAAPPDRRSLKFFQRSLFHWGHANFIPFPWRFTENKFHALLAEMMLQRTRAEQVVPVYNEFIRRYPTASLAAKARPATIE